MKSALLQRGVDKEIFVISDAVEKPTVLPGITLHWDRALDNMSEKINYAVKHLFSKDSEGFLFLSDDTVCAPDYAASLYEVSNWTPMLVSGLSNNDVKRYFYAEFPFSYSVELTDDVVNYALSQPKERNILISVDMTPFFAIYISKDVWDKIGEFDEDMGVRWNDFDYSIRASKLGIKTCINTGVFCLHLGSKTVSSSPKVEFDIADIAFTKKYGESIK